MKGEFYLTFPAASAAERSRLARALHDTLASTRGIEQIQIRRENDDAQDSGTILSIVLGAPAVVLAVKTIGAWLTRSNQIGLRITLPDSTVVINNVDSEHLAEAIMALEKALKSRR